MKTDETIDVVLELDEEGLRDDVRTFALLLEDTLDVLDSHLINIRDDREAKAIAQKIMMRYFERCLEERASVRQKGD